MNYTRDVLNEIYGQPFIIFPYSILTGEKKESENQTNLSGIAYFVG